MKRIIFILPMLLYSIIVNGQNRVFDGVWEGEISTSKDESMTIYLYIEDNNVYNLIIDEDGAKNKDHEVSWSKGYDEQLNYVWMNKGGVWTETQMFSLVWISDEKLSVHFLRYVSNESGDFDGNTDWGYTGEGVLNKL